MIGKEIKEIKQSSHHKNCLAEYSGTAYARTMKTEAVVFKSKYGGSSKQVYDTKILSVSGKFNNVTALDMAEGYKTSERAAKSALNKSSNRKSALLLEVVKIDDNVIDKTTTKIV